AQQGEAGGRLERRILRNRAARRAAGELTESKAAAAWRVAHHAPLGTAGGGVHPPLLCRGANEHLPRGGAGLPERDPVVGDAAAAAGVKPDALEFASG